MTAVPSTTTTRGLERAFRPRSVAVLGASSRPGALSGRFITGLQRHGFSGRIVPVNPRRDVILDLPCAPSVGAASQDGPIDLAIVSLPRELVRDALVECRDAGVGAAAVFTSGFSEMGEEGAALEAELAEVVAGSDLRVLGPNSPGLINVNDATCAIASGVGFREELVPGGISLVSQSGGAAGLIVERAQDDGVGIRMAVCTGNEVDVQVGEVLTWFAQDDETKVATVFLEGIRDVEALSAGMDALRAAGKPLVVLKAGGTDIAARASAAHTGSLASDHDVALTYLRSHGAVCVSGFDELIDCAVALERLGPAKDGTVGIITTSGGAGIVATEAAERSGLELPPITDATHARLEAILPDFAAIGNPADMSGMFSEKPEIFHESLRAFTEAPEFDTAVMVLTVHPLEVSNRLAGLILDSDVNGLAVLWTAGEMAGPARRTLARAGVAVFEDAERCMRALRARHEASTTLGTAPTITAAGPIAVAAGTAVTEHEALALLDGTGVPVAESRVCATAEEAAAAARAMGDVDVVVKASARDLQHKSDAGAVVVGVRGDADVAAAHDRVVDAARRAGATPEGSIVQRMAGKGVELIVGVRRDPVLGPVIVVGAGGILAELGSGVARRMLPLREGDAAAMLAESAAAPLLAGYRGDAAADLDAAVTAIEGIARAAVAVGDTLEAVEVNPLIVHPRGEGATAVDALLITEAIEG
ncbi:MAG: acetate--CoA ligase family protein [Solirubrobacteraceae bacterium]|nr:acetate--CoA ligase family protein [Solirubrobacteraceae bacterium]